ncbi:Not3-domain-containing protein [Metschnikowia bicuspidata]|uniref:Not3-domain-containing protein n=1 Tax=Metschnikowia bicuspidata TaxID=27322 RepID=A0A4P9ZGT8_9ASCO|nr:Not3-domain-containing protein [Metschnikowia bicuspidata]
MSSRKLQQEFDKLQKKVTEGLAQFDQTHDKIYATDNSSLKEKLESELRKEIKKLQRYRDQVKQWLSDSSNKLDRSRLQDIRGLIESAMERFKEVEKVLKMKQFSNEGLELQMKLGARGLDEAKKIEALKYITEVLEELNRQNELLSAEIDQLHHKRKLAALQATIDELAEKIDRNNAHVARLEHVLRNLENNKLEPAKIDDIRDDLDYYLENNQADDFVEYDDFYDVLELDESLEVGPVFPTASVESLPSATPSPKKAPSMCSNTPSERSAPASAPAASPGLGLAAAKSSAPLSASRLTVAEELKKKALAQAAAAAAPPPNPQEQPTAGQQILLSASLARSVSNDSSAMSLLTHTLAVALPSPLPALSHEGKYSDGTFRPTSMVDTRLKNPPPFSAIVHQLEASLINCPDSFDLEVPRQYNPINVHPSSIDYPQEPMYELNSAAIMKKFDTHTLFFCFYYNEGIYNLSKYNAAKELSARGWIFNSETKQWFCKNETTRPRNLSLAGTTSTKGSSYKYFDYQGSWLVCRKENYELNPRVQQTFSLVL